MNPVNRWDAVQEDILREIGNIGAGNAATALSALLQESVTISMTNARLCSFDDISLTVGGAEVVTAGIFLRMSGDVSGSMLLLLPLDSAKKLLLRLLPDATNEDGFTDLELSALGEVGNILGASYLNALSTLTSLRMHQSVPGVAIDMAGAILDVAILVAGESSDSAVLINTVIKQGESDVNGHFFLLPDPISMQPLLNALQVYHD